MRPLAFCTAAFMLFANHHEARASMITVDFTASFLSSAAPQNPVIGSITYEAADLTSPPTSIDSVSLSIAGHIYSVAEIGWGGSTNAIEFGGLINGRNTLAQGTDDFFFTFSAVPPYIILPQFQYTVAGVTGNFQSNVLLDVNVTEQSAVPEPSSLALLGLGGVGLTLGGWRQKRRRNNLQAPANSPADS